MALFDAFIFHYFQKKMELMNSLRYSLVKGGQMKRKNLVPVIAMTISITILVLGIVLSLGG